MPLLTVSARPGAGKTATTELLIEWFDAKRVPSLTTRPLGTRDLNPFPEYIEVTVEDLDLMEENDELAWRVKVHDYEYATTWGDLEVACASNELWIMVIAHNVVKNVHALSFEDRILSVYLLAESDDFLRANMLNRGDDPVEIERRLLSSANWDEEYMKCLVPYVTLRSMRMASVRAMARMMTKILMRKFPKLTYKGPTAP
ncbi:MAG: hypothetical protein HZA95_00635 [Candidatus Vogelbacteria bacterium]|nr:hypothetical protein [Candidatus Vogelbacteria bacterium]